MTLHLIDWYHVRPLIWNFIVGTPGANKSGANSLLTEALKRVEPRLRTYYNELDEKYERKPIENRTFWAE